MVVLFHHNAIFRSNMKLLMAVPFLKGEHFMETYMLIKKRLMVGFASETSLNQFFEYFERMYVGGLTHEPIFKTEDVSLYERCLQCEPLTTNASEGWHKGLNWNINEVHPKFGRLVNFLIRNNALVEREVMDLLKTTSIANSEFVVKRKTEELQKLAAQYEKNDCLIYLELVLRIYDFTVYAGDDAENEIHHKVNK